MYYVLFTTTTCTKCPSFKKVVFENVKFEGNILNEQSAEFADFAQKFNVSAAPTFIVFEDESLEKEIFRCSEEYELVDYLKSI